MTFRHGSYVTENPTSLGVPVVATAALPAVFGTAPINLAQSLEYVNKPFIAYSFEEAVKALGYSDDWKSYTLCEMMDAAFRQFQVAPIVFINVLDPATHKVNVPNSNITVTNKKAEIKTKGILLDSLVVKNGATELEKGTDYIASFDNTGNVVIALLNNLSATELSVSYDRIAPELVVNNDIIGGVDINTGKSKGLELLNSIFPKFGLVPGQVLAPGYSKNPTVASVMKAKASSINTYFRAISLDDVDTKAANVYTKVNEWKNTNNYTGTNEGVCWPMVGLGEKVYHLSTQLACRIVKTASDNRDYPYESPSNKPLSMNRLLVETDTGYDEVELGPDQAELLNNQGIITALNFIGGFKAWGNNTGAYPSSTDVKDIFIPVRITHNWIANTIILTTWSKVDGPIKRSLIDSVLDTMNMWFNGLQSAGVVLGGRVEFREADNPIANLLGGKVVFRYFTAEPTPAQEIENILEFDATYYNNLFA